MELCGVKSLSFAVGTYLPLSTTLPIFVGGFLRGIADKKAAKTKEVDEEEDLRKGNLFATGLVAGGALFGVIAAILTVFFEATMNSVNMEESFTHSLGHSGYMALGVGFFAMMCFILYKVATGKKKA
jgi:hypothetical protein